MAVTATPVFTQVPLLAQTQVTTANSNRDGATGSYSTAISVGANGSLIDYILFQATVTTAAGLIRIFYSPDAGTTWRLLAEVVTSSATVSGTVGGAQVVWTPPGGLPLPAAASSQFKFNIANTETWTCLVAGGNL